MHLEMTVFVYGKHCHFKCLNASVFSEVLWPHSNGTAEAGEGEEQVHSILPT